MKTKISLQCLCLLVFYDILYWEGSEMGGSDGDELVAWGITYGCVDINVMLLTGYIE